LQSLFWQFMFSTDDLISFASASIDTCANEELQQRLSLYQVFLKLYEQNRGLLDELLRLENSSSKALAEVTLPYVQGVVAGDQVQLVTNLLGGKTQSLNQPQHTWLLGRDPRKVNIAVQDNRLSRCHATIQFIANEFYLTDLGSSNGSFINGEQIWRSTVLKEGDRVRLGSLSFVFFVCQTGQTLPPLAIEVLSQLQASAAKLPNSQVSAEGAPAVPPLQETFNFPYSKLDRG
jgi:hypothetical protein